MTGRLEGRMGQMELEMPGPVEDLRVRRYWEHAGPRRWLAVVVRVRYGPVQRTPAGPVLPDLVTGRVPPRNVLVERPDGTREVRPVRLLRTRCPG